MLSDELVVDIIYLVIPSPTDLDIDGIPCPEFLLIPLLSNSEQQSLEFHSTFSLLNQSLGLPMFSTPSRDYRILLVAPASFHNWVLCFTS
jgi:hypothetical protein